ncbi:hypothetical protein D6827_01950, partial [Candidatus Parcubacteria bacterium]
MVRDAMSDCRYWRIDDVVEKNKVTDLGLKKQENDIFGHEYIDQYQSFDSEDIFMGFVYLPLD